MPPRLGRPGDAMQESEAAARVRMLTQATSEVVNALVRLAAPEKFASLPDVVWPELRRHVGLLRAQGFGPFRALQLDLDVLEAILPELDIAVADAVTSEAARARVAALAREYVNQATHLSRLMP